MVAAVLLEAGLPFLAKVLSESLMRVDSPLAQVASVSLGKVSEAITGGMITPEQMAEANRHAEAMAGLQAQTDKEAYVQVNESLRAEIGSSDVYVRRMRPTFGYMIAMTWGAQMLAVAYVIMFETEKARVVIDAMASLGTIWTVGLSVLGIYVYKRSDEKKIVSSYAAPTVQMSARVTGDGPQSPAPAKTRNQFNE